MTTLIGEIAGRIWSYLDTNGDSSIPVITKKLNLKKEQVTFSLGWLAREGKIIFVEKGKTVQVSLND